MTTNPSLTSGSGPASKEKIRRVRTLTEEALEQGNFTQDQLQCVHANGGEYKCEYSDFLREFARRRTTAAASSSPIPTMPAEDEWFELTVDNNIDPMSVVTSAGFDATKWEYLGPPFSGVKNYRVKLIALGYVRNLDEAKAAAKLKNPKYQLLEGQAREAFKAKYPRHNGRPVVFGGSEWQDPNRDRRVAYLGYLHGGEWSSDFDWSERDFGGDWLWAVVEQD